MNDENQEILDSETQDEGGDDFEEETSSETERDSDEIEKAQKIAEDQKRRAEKAEQKLKELKAQLEKSNKSKETQSEPKSDGQKETTVSNDTLTKEEAILYARGLSEEEVEKVKSIAKIEGESPLVAAESDYFKIWQDKKKKETEAQETQLGTSKGSMKTQPKKTFSDSLSKDEHKKLWESKMGR